jgi:hypothetical protein
VISSHGSIDTLTAADWRPSSFRLGARAKLQPVLGRSTVRTTRTGRIRMATTSAADIDKGIAGKSYVHPEVLVSTEWLAQNLDNPKVRIIESDEDVLL